MSDQPRTSKTSRNQQSSDADLAAILDTDARLECAQQRYDFIRATAATRT
jgi:hypothetical protein